jgi:hypothetical protein
MIGLQAKLIGGAVLLTALVAAGFFGVRAIYGAGHTAGKAEVQVTFDKFKADVAKAANDQALQNAADAAAATKLDREKHDEYEAQIAAARADVGVYAERLRNALARLAAGSGASAPAPSGQGLAPASGPSSDDRLGQLSQLIAAERAECIANDDRLDALVAEVTPQVAP